jgi:spermidine synthase
LGIVLASWLIWTATGSIFFGKLVKKSKDPVAIMVVLQLLISILIPFTIFLIRFSRNFFQSAPGEILGILSILFDSIIILAPFCLISGAFFSVGCFYLKQISADNLANATGTVYLLEAVGSGVGGILASFILLQNFSSIQIGLILSLLNILAANFLIFKKSKSVQKYWIFLFSLFLTILLLVYSTKLNNISISSLWTNFNILESRNSIFGNVTLVENNQIKTFFENGLIVHNIPDLQTAEELVHFPLLLHPKPKELLFIGGGIAGGIEEALKHPSIEKIDYLELDPTIFEIFENHFPEKWHKMTKNPMIINYVMDGRLFIKQTETKYDAIILNIPDPQTAQINRFYTLEFFREVANKLHPKGLLSFQITAAENYISDELENLLKCIFQTLKGAFPTVLVMPGENAHFFAFKKKTEIELTADIFLENLKERSINTLYVNESFIPFRLMPDRLIEFNKMLFSEKTNIINRDFIPAAYYFNLVLWGTKFFPAVQYFFPLKQNKHLILIISVMALCLLFFLFFITPKLSKKQYFRTNSIFAIVIMGFNLMTIEIIIILAFQAIYGYVYFQIASIIASFMTGLALGSWYALRKMKLIKTSKKLKVLIKNLSFIHFIIVFLAPITFGFFLFFRNSVNQNFLQLSSQIAFPVLALLWGIIGGYQFPIVNSIYLDNNPSKKSNVGFLYGLDLLGALFGSLSMTIFIIPLFGFFKGLIFLSVLNAIIGTALGKAYVAEDS